jgi:hypothetical protein
MRERQLYSSVISFFSENGFSCQEEMCLFKVPGNHNKKVDLLFEKNRKSIGVEVKIKDWKRALIQAYLNSFYVSKCYVALWHKTAKNVDMELFKRYKIGLISVKKDVASVIIEG